MSRKGNVEFVEDLAVRDRLNHPYLIAKQILTIQQATLSKENSAREIREAIMGLVTLIPTSWKKGKAGKSFIKQEKKAIITKDNDIRPFVFGNVRMDVKVCESLGIATVQKVTRTDHLLLLQACIDLLYGRKMLSKPDLLEHIKLIEDPEDVKELDKPLEELVGVSDDA